MKRLVNVVQLIEVEVDETKFTPEFMREFRENFYNFGSIGAHMEHLAQLCARGLDREFIEGYGPAIDFGIKLRQVDCECETVEVPAEGPRRANK